MELKNRIVAIKKHFKLNNSQLGRIAGITSASMASIENGITLDPKVSIFQNIASKLGVNIEWLLLGKGNMLSEPIDQKKSEPSYGRPEVLSSYVTMPIITQHAAASYLAGIQSPGFSKEMAYMVLPRFMATIGQYAVFQVRDESMVPTFKNSEYVICSKFERGEWAYINDLEAVVVVSKKHGIQLRRIKNRLSAKGFIHFLSDNDIHSSFFLEVEEIAELWRVQWKLTTSTMNHLSSKVKD